MAQHPTGAIRLFDAQFPVYSEVGVNESGLGYCLRLAELNGVGIAQLKRVVGSAPNGSFRSIHALALGRLFRTDCETLKHRLPDLYCNGATMYGHRFERRGMLRIKTAQVCPRCIHENGYLIDIWDIGASVCCLKHGICLVDQCPSCHVGVSWARSSISWGQCGHYLGSDVNLKSASQELMLAQWVLEHILRRRVIFEEQSMNEGMQIFTSMSLSSWIELMFALGLRERPWQPINFSTFSFSPVAKKMQKILLRGIVRLQKLMTAEDSGKSLSSVVYEDLLGRLALGAFSEFDRALCQRLYKTVFGVDRYLHLQHRIAVEIQLDMFGHAL